MLTLLTLLLLGLGLVWGLPARRLRSLRAVAAFAGQRHPPMASDLLSAVELDVGDDHQLPQLHLASDDPRLSFGAVADAASPIASCALAPAGVTRPGRALPPRWRP